MKRIILSGLMAALLSVTPIFGEEMTNAITPGITPDSALYTIDQLVEDIQLSLTVDIQKKAQLLLAITQERLAEAKLMTEEDKVEYVQKAMEAYGQRIEEAFEMVSEVILKEAVDDATKETLSTQLEDSAEVIESVEAVINEEQKERLSEKRDSAYLVANVVRDLDVDKVILLRETKGFGYGQIAKVFLLADASGKSIDEIADLMASEGKGFGEIAKDLGIHPSELKAKANKSKQVLLNSQLKEAKTVLEDAQLALKTAKETEDDEAEKIAEEKITEVEKITREAEKNKKRLEKELQKIEKKLNKGFKEIDDQDDKDDDEDEDDDSEKLRRQEKKRMEKINKALEKTQKEAVKQQQKKKDSKDDEKDK